MKLPFLNNTQKTSGDLQRDIEHQATAISQREAAIVALEGLHREAVLSGDESRISDMERQIATERAAIDSHRSRTAILAGALIVAEEDERVAALADRHARSKAALEASRPLIAAYRKQADALATTLGQLTAVEAFISRNGRGLGPDFEDILTPYSETRYSPEKSHVEIETYWTYPGIGTPTQNEVRSVDGLAAPERPDRRRNGVDANQQPIYVEPELRRREVNVVDASRIWLDHLDKLVVIPGVAIGDRAIWDDARRRESIANAESTVAALLANSKPKARAA